MSTLKTNNIQHVDRSDPSIIINTDGSVNIAGTMTYEDVTNVDSVGIITARSGVRINDGGLNVTAGISTFGGHVAINTTSSPTYQLEVHGATDASIRIKTNNTGASDDTIFRNLIGGTSANNYIYFGDSADSNAGQIRYSHTNDFLSIHTNAAERMRITSAGDVGIGTNNPSGKLNIVTSGSNALNIIQDTGDLSIRLNDRGTGSAYIKVPDGSGALTFETGSSERLRIKSDGGIGIGTAAANGATLEIQDIGSTGPCLLLQAATSTEGDITVPDGQAINIGHWNLSDTFTERLRIEPSGTVGISTGSVTHKLHVYGAGNSGGARFENPHQVTSVSGNTAANSFPHNILLSNYENGGTNRMATIGFDITTGSSNAHANAVIAYQATGSGTGDLQLHMENNNSIAERLRITSTGLVGIGTDNPLNPLAVVGSSADIMVYDTDDYSQNVSGGAVAFAGKDSAGNRKTFADVRGVANGSNIGEFAIRTRRTGGTITEALRIDSSGRLLTGGATSSHGSTNADDLTIGANNQSNQTGITLGSASASSVRFADASDDTAGAVNYIHGDDTMRFSTGSSERVRITNDGLTFNGESAAANALDDYEEGTLNWKLQKSDGGDIGSDTGSVVRYVKVGRLVHISGRIRTDSTGSNDSGYFQFTSGSTLPFPPETNGAAVIGHFRSQDQVDSSLTASIAWASGSTTLYIYTIDSRSDYTATTNNVPVSSQTNLVITFTFTYRANA